VRRRLRKKKHLEEFQELGFDVHVELSGDLGDAEFHAFIRRLIDAVEARHLAFGGGGGGGKAFDGFVTRAGRGSATDDDRRALGELLDGDAAVVRHEVGALVDAWR
jgi:uncharacterized protein YggL (DUF469 family)